MFWHFLKAVTCRPASLARRAACPYKFGAQSRGVYQSESMIVVTGGAGFIGSNLVAALQARGERDIVVVDRFGSDDKWRNIAKRDLTDIIEPERLNDLDRRQPPRHPP